MHINRETAEELQRIIDDSLEQFSDNERISGELAWQLFQCLATAKLAEKDNEII